MKIKDTSEGKTLKKQRDEIMAQIRKLAQQNGLTAANSPHAED